MSLAGETLKDLYPSLIHVNYVTRILHNCAMCMRACFKNIDEVIATIKAATIKNKDHKKNFHVADLPSLLDPVIASWATSLKAALSCNENLNSSCLCHCQQLDKCIPLIQQSKRRYYCGRFGAEFDKNKSILDSSSQRKVLRRKFRHDNRSIKTAEEYAMR